MTSDIVTLKNAHLRLRVVPSNGGGILDLVTRDGRIILDGPGGPEGPPQGLGCFPMTPFCGRLPGGLVDPSGSATTALDPNLPQGGIAHGVGWLRRWRVVGQRSGALVLAHMHAGRAGVWPWRYECRQHIGLRGNSATLTLITRNVDDAPMPCASGFHPYVARSSEASLFVDGTRLAALEQGEGQPATGRDLWLAGASRQTRLTASTNAWMIYRPTDRSAVCLEPYVGGFDQSPTVTLAPGVSQRVSLRIAVI